MSNLLVRVDVQAPQPLMHPAAASRFLQLREAIKRGAGFDFLARCGDICRSPNFVSRKDGVANRSWHKTGRAFDYDQECKRLVVVSEIKNGKQFFRTFLRCMLQDGSQGEQKALKDYCGNSFSGFYFDFTAAAEAVGFERIPAWNGWERNYNRREFWHYQFDQNLTWEEAMSQLKGGLAPLAVLRQAEEKILGLNDRGEAVQAQQKQLVRLGFLPANEADGVFGAKTKAAVIEFQKANRLDADGTIGKLTRAALSAQETKGKTDDE